MQPAIRTFFDEATFTATHVVWDPGARRAVIIDSVKDYDPKSGRTATASADAVIAFVEAETLAVEWILETHVHADRSEEHTSELQSLMRISYAVFCLKKKNITQQHPSTRKTQ